MSPQTLERDFADLEQSVLALVDQEFLAEHGDPAKWSGPDEAQYVKAITRVHAVFHPEAAAGNEVAA